MSSTMTYTSASSSSSKRPAPSTPSTPAAKRARPSNASDDQDAEELEPEVALEDMDEETKAKELRRQARTIRNRESAQRSRNQRKAHLAWLEARVVELEAENRALRTGSAPSTPGKTRESSPANSIVSLASDLGLPPEIVSTGGGVNLATVAPPPADVLEDIKPVLPLETSAAPVPPPMSSAVEPANPDNLRSENAALRWRVGMLENIVKQAATFFSSYNTGAPAVPSPHRHHHHQSIPSTPMMPMQQPPSPGMDVTLSPPLYPATSRDAVRSPLRLDTRLASPSPNLHPSTVPSALTGDAVSSYVDLSTPVARHPAEVAISSAVSPQTERRGATLPRARGSLNRINLDLPANQERLAQVARVIVALARLRGWTSATTQPRSIRRLKSESARRTPGSLRASRRRRNGTRK